MFGTTSMSDVPVTSMNGVSWFATCALDEKAKMAANRKE